MQRIEIAIQIIITTVLTFWLVADCYNKTGVKAQYVPSTLNALKLSTQWAPWDASYQSDYLYSMTRAHDVIKNVKARKYILAGSTAEALRMTKKHPNNWGGHYALAIAIYFNHKLGMRLKDGGLERAEMAGLTAYTLNRYHPGVLKLNDLIRMEMK